MDARNLLRRYLEQRREVGESELVLDSLQVEDVMRLLGAAGRPAPPQKSQRSVREIAGEPSENWRASLREAGVNVEAVLTDVEPVSSTPSPDTQNEMAFKKGIVVAANEAELIPAWVEKLDSLDEVAKT